MNSRSQDKLKSSPKKSNMSLILALPFIVPKAHSSLVRAIASERRIEVDAKDPLAIEQFNKAESFLKSLENLKLAVEGEIGLEPNKILILLEDLRKFAWEIIEEQIMVYEQAPLAEDGLEIKCLAARDLYIYGDFMVKSSATIADSEDGVLKVIETLSTAGLLNVAFTEELSWTYRSNIIERYKLMIEGYRENGGSRSISSLKPKDLVDAHKYQYYYSKIQNFLNEYDELLQDKGVLKNDEESLEFVMVLSILGEKMTRHYRSAWTSKTSFEDAFAIRDKVFQIANIIATASKRISNKSIESQMQSMTTETKKQCDILDLIYRGDNSWEHQIKVREGASSLYLKDKEAFFQM